MADTTEGLLAADDPAARLGTVGKLEDGRTYVRFERRLPYSVARVWAALTEPQQRNLWFPGFNLEPVEGGRFEMRFGAQAGECDGPPHVAGTVVELKPMRVLQCDNMRWELAADGEEGCLLTFSDILVFDGARSSEEITNSVLGGWHQGMDFLEDALAGETVRMQAPEVDYSRFEIAGRA